MLMKKQLVTLFLVLFTGSEVSNVWSAAKSPKGSSLVQGRSSFYRSVSSPYSSWGVDPSVKAGHINLGPALSQFKLKEEVKIAVIDTGIDFNHEFLHQNLYVPSGTVGPNNYGLDFSKKGSANTVPNDEHGHGTHVAGIIKSVFPQAKLLILKYYNPLASGQENLASTIRALRYAVNSDVDIINYSGGGPEPSPEEQKILELASQKGIVVVAAAGNERSNIDKRKNAYYPASYGMENIITVTAHDKQASTLPSSNWGRRSIDISAPGKQILSAIPQGRSGMMTGTSQATAFVTGVAGLIKANYPQLNSTQIRLIIKKSARKLQSMKTICASGGVLDAAHALSMAKEVASNNRKIAFEPKNTSPEGKIIFLKSAN